jgi:VIT1/CCC1 family predicted Fe2+/Mn2+ transporter
LPVFGYVADWWSLFIAFGLLGGFLLVLGFLALLGALSAYVGGAPITKASTRIVFWGALAMVITIGVGKLFEVSV